MTALFDEPLRVSLTAEGVERCRPESPVGLMMGIVSREKATLFMVVLPDGRMDLLDRSEFTVDWRYDVQRDRFVDLNAGQAPAEQEQEA